MYLANPNVIIGHPSAVGAARQLWGKCVKQAPCRVQTTQPAAGDVVKVTSATGGGRRGVALDNGNGIHFLLFSLKCVTDAPFERAGSRVRLLPGLLGIFSATWYSFSPYILCTYSYCVPTATRHRRCTTHVGSSSRVPPLSW